MKVLLFDPSAGASGDMIIASLLDLGADVDAVREAVESVGCRLEVSRQEKSHIIACRARVISDRRYQSLDEAKSILQNSCQAMPRCAGSGYVRQCIQGANLMKPNMLRGHAVHPALRFSQNVQGSEALPGSRERFFPAGICGRGLRAVGARSAFCAGTCGSGNTAIS
jgi:hypothetical protein